MLNHDQKEAYGLIQEALGADAHEIADWQPLKAGMTNSSYTFLYQGKKYIIRLPGEGTEQLINRKQEYEVYQAVRDLHISDKIHYINPENGYKISEFIFHTRNCDPKNLQEVKKCMELLREFHANEIKVAHFFDLREKIDFYGELFEKKSVYADYEKTREKINWVLDRIDEMPKECRLTHMDAVPDNFLIETLEDGGEQIRLIDWEYAGMQDPHVDIAMFAIYAMYDAEEIEQLIELYFEAGCDPVTRTKIYGYIACSGLLWSNWCEYKRVCGIDFGEYAHRQYQYAKQYSEIFERNYFQHV